MGGEEKREGMRRRRRGRRRRRKKVKRDALGGRGTQTQSLGINDHVMPSHLPTSKDSH